MLDKFKFLTGKRLTLLFTLLGLYLFSTGVSLAIFSFVKGDPGVSSQDVDENRKRIGEGLPKTEKCPINGALFSEPEREIWETRRPITAMIENHLEARPQSGLSSADVVYEAVAEGGITRFLAVFYCGASAADVRIGPIRSVRVYFVDWAAEYGKNPIFVHIGGANNICNNCPGGVKPPSQVAREVDAFRLLSTMGWRYAKGNSFDGGTNIGYPIIIRDQFRLGEKAAWEHSVVGFTDKIFEEAQKRGFGYESDNGDPWIKDFKSWSFTEDKASSSPKAPEISFGFWEGKGDYDVSWKYDSGKNAYLRFNGGKEHVDYETKEQIAAKNVVIMFVSERGPVDSEGHMVYTTVDKGNALIFQNGDVIEGIWEKSAQKERTIFTDDNGEEISFVPGQIWIEAVPRGNDIDY